MHFKVHVSDRTYTDWQILYADNNKEVDTSEQTKLKQVNPLAQKLFARDIFTLSENDNSPVLVHSYFRTCDAIAGVLILENNRTFGRTENGKRLFYQCIPDDAHLPIFLLPYELKVGFSKNIKNKYVVFKYDSWDGKHPHGKLTETLGDVDKLDVFYEYQLYCKSLHTSLTDFTSKTKERLNQKPSAEYIEQIQSNRAFNIVDARDKYIFTIDPINSLDFDDGFSVDETPNGEYIVTVYIANVFIWLETLGLWDSFSKRVATIYLPDRRRPMLPTILSDILCSLQQKQDRFAFAIEFTLDAGGEIIKEPIYKNVFICVKKNYTYEQREMVFKDKKYLSLLAISQKQDPSIKNSHDLVAHWMIQMNSHTGCVMTKMKTGIFRAACFIDRELRNDIQTESRGLDENTLRVIKMWNNTIGQYVLFDKDVDNMIRHDLMKATKAEGMHSYVHITSPIRRLVDLLNQMIMFEQLGIVTSMSSEAKQFMQHWFQQLDFVNTSMRSIRKVQVDCEILNKCYCNPAIAENLHVGVLFDKVMKNNGIYSYMVYLEELKLLSRITTPVSYENYSKQHCKLFLFEDEDKVKRKIRLEIV